MKIAGENKMFGLGRKTEEKNISSMEEALGIVKKAGESGTIDRVRIKSNFKFSEEEKNNLELFIQRYFKPEESSYHCKGKHSMRESKGQAKSKCSISLYYFNQVHQEVAPMNIGFAFAGGGSWGKSDNVVPDTQTNIIRKAIIEFYVK